MSKTVFALLVASTQAETPERDPIAPPAGTATVDCGECNQGQWWYYGDLEERFTTLCDTSSDCQGEWPCVILQIADAHLPGVCLPAQYCGISESEITNDGEVVEPAGPGGQSGFCNRFQTTAAGMDLDIEDAFFWYNWTKDLTSCTTDADCTTTGQVCGTNTLDTATGQFCAAMDGGCAYPETDSAGALTGAYGSASWDVPRSLNKANTSCTSDTFTEWLWKTNNIVDQATAAGCATVDPECNTITWDGSAGVAAFCGTAKLENDSDYAVLGCYPTADCELMGGLIPGTEAKYILACGATSLFASAFAATAAVVSLM